MFKRVSALVLAAIVTSSGAILIDNDLEKETVFVAAMKSTDTETETVPVIRFSGITDVYAEFKVNKEIKEDPINEIEEEPIEEIEEVIEEIVEEPVEEEITEEIVEEIVEEVVQPGPAISNAVKIEMTAYCSCAYCCGKETGITASGTRVRIGTIAAPKTIALGTNVYIPDLEWYKSDGIFTVEDRGGAIVAKADGTLILDVWFPDHQTALKFGRRSSIMYIQ